MLALGLGVTSSLTSIDGLVRGPYSEGGLFPRLALDFDDNKYATDVGSVTFADAFMAASPKLTYSTTSNSTMVNSSGNIVWSPHNFITYSEDFANAAWLKTDATISGTLTSSPDGQTNGRTVTFAGTNDLLRFIGPSCSVGESYTASIWAKAGTSSSVKLSILFSGSGLGSVDEVITLTSEWQRFTISGTVPSGTPDTARMRFTSLEAGSIQIFGAHLFRSDLGGMGQVPGAATGFEYYVPTSGSAKRLPRVGHHVYSGSAWVNEGLLIESEERTNLVTYSEDFSQNFLFGAGGGSITSTNNPSPSGVNTATLVTATSGRVYLYTSISLSGSTNKDYTASCWVKGVTEGTKGRLRIGFFGGAQGGGFTTGTYENLSTTEWTRISLTGVSSESDRSSAQLVVETETESQLIVFGAQLEEGSTPSSYIPTSGATVTRAAQTLVVPPAAFGWNSSAVSIQMDGRMTYANEGTFVAQRLYKWSIDGNNFLDVLVRSDANLGQVVFRQKESGTADEKTTATGTYSPGTLVSFNIASRHGSTFINGAVDGTALTANTTPTALADLENTNLEIAQDFMGTVRTFRQFAGDIGDAGLATATS